MKQFLLAVSKLDTWHIIIYGIVLGAVALVLWQYSWGQLIVAIVVLLGTGVIGALLYTALRLAVEKHEHDTKF